MGEDPRIQCLEVEEGQEGGRHSWRREKEMP